MEGYSVNFSILLFYLLLAWSSLLAEAQTQHAKAPLVSALYLFGDSTIDPGNNNGLNTIAKANFPPYGRDFFDARPTGRFTNGKLVTDIISGLLGLPDLLPANMDPEFRGQKLLTGASFGSSASGLDDSTALSFNALPLGKQLENFRDYRSQLVDMVGQENASKIISGAIFAISTGTDDFALNYYINSSRRKKYSVTQFQDILIQSLSGFIQGINGEGATRFAIVGLPAFGCLPAQITLYNSLGNTCVERLNEVAVSFNNKAKDLAENTRLSFPGIQVIYVDIYEKVYDMVKYPSKYGFEEVRKGCCGTGVWEASIFCTKSPTCADASKYVFWDSFHPTSQAYNFLGEHVFEQFLRLFRLNTQV